MFGKIARFSVKFRWIIIIAWIASVPLLTANLPSITDVSKNDNSDFLPKNSPSMEAIDLESNFQSKDTASTATIVAVRDDAPLSDSDNAAIDAVSAKVKKLHGISMVQDQGDSADGKARQVQVGINGAAFGDEATKVVDDIRGQFKDAPSGLKLHLTGEFASGIDSEAANSKGRNNTELYTVIFIIVLLLFVFRALLAPIITLLPAGLALAVAQPIIAQSTHFGVDVSFITQILLIVLVLGAGTDYGLFLVFRVREELRKGHAPKEAVIRALDKVGESITFSALTVIAALISLLIASFGIYRGLGPALAIGLTVMLLIALTFLPAVLAVLGRAVFWPSKTRATEPKIGLWGKAADGVIKRPITTLVIGIAIFTGLGLGVIGFKTAGFVSDPAPATTDSAIGQAVIAKHFPAANINPQLLLLGFDKPVWDNLAAIQTAEQELEKSGRFKSVSGPFNANGFVSTPEQLAELHATNPNSPILKAVSQFISPDGKTVQLYGISNAGEPGSTASTKATPANRAALEAVANKVGADKNAIFSTDAVGYDINKVANNDLKKIIPLVLVIIGLLLALMLRSLVAPIYLIATVGLSYLASLGFAMLLFVHFGGDDGINFIVPFMLFIFSTALGEDYNILVMSRIREEAHNHTSVKEAVAKAIGITGSTVTAAGLILAGTFGVLGFAGGNDQVEQIGYSIAFGILLDTFFVRTLLVPSIVVLLGRWNWWPSKLHRNSTH